MDGWYQTSSVTFGVFIERTFVHDIGKNMFGFFWRFCHVSFWSSNAMMAHDLHRDIFIHIQASNGACSCRGNRCPNAGNAREEAYKADDPMPPPSNFDLNMVQFVMIESKARGVSITRIIERFGVRIDHTHHSLLSWVILGHLSIPPKALYTRHSITGTPLSRRG